MAASSGEPSSPAAPFPVRLQAYSRYLWVLAVLSYGVGDTATTVVGVSTGRAAEGGPIMSAAITEAGMLGLVATKLATLVGFYLVWRAVTSPGRVGVPLALSLVGLVVTTWNLFVLLS